MSDLEFVDTNVCLYAFDNRTPDKQAVAANLIERLSDERRLALSTQVLAEFCAVIARRKIDLPDSESVHRIIEELARHVVHRPESSDIQMAMHIASHHRIHFWDAMIVRSAQAMGATLLWTEDLSDDATFGDVRVRNPFAAR